MKNLILITFTLCLSTFSFAKAKWATPVHSHFIDRAFPNDSLSCRTKMKLGSIMADSYHFQGEENAHMHAMRTEGQTVAQAEEKMWKWIRTQYDEIRRHIKTFERNPARLDAGLKICYERGLALHPVMDATSPAHSGFQLWDPYDITTAIFNHGDVREVVEEETGYSLGLPHSHEDMDALKLHPALESSTIKILQQVDSILRVKDDESIRILVFKKK